MGAQPPTSNDQATNNRGAVAQLGEHLLCKEGVRSSSLLGSTNASLAREGAGAVDCENEEKQGRQRARTATPFMRNPNRAIE